MYFLPFSGGGGGNFCESRDFYRDSISNTPNLFEMQISKPPETKTLEMRPSNMGFAKPSSWFWYVLKFENNCIKVCNE